MATVGKVSILFEAQSAAFSKATKQAQEDLHSVSESAKTAGEVIKGAFEVLAIAEGVNILREWVSSSIESAVAAYRLSASLGITTQSLQGLQAAAKLSGVGTDEFNTILEHLVKNLGTAAEGTGPAAEALQKLGLDAGALKGLGVDTAFERIAQKISEITDPIERARAEVELFGKSGQQLDPLLMKGAAGIEEAKKKAVELGIALSDVDAAKLIEAHEAMEKVGMAFDGIKNQLAIALAPIIEAIADKIGSILPAADKVRDGILTGLRVMAYGVGFLMDAYEVLKTGVLAVEFAIVGTIEIIERAIRSIVNGIIWVENKLFHRHDTTPQWIDDSIDQIKAMRQSIGEDVGTAANAIGSHTQAAGKFFDDLQAKADESAKAIAATKPGAALADDFDEAHKKVQSILEKLRQEVADFGLSAVQKQINELKLSGASAVEIGEITALAAQLDTLQKQKAVTDDLIKLRKELAEVGLSDAQKVIANLKENGADEGQVLDAQGIQDKIEAANKMVELQKDAKKIIEDSLTPIEKYRQAVAQLDEMLKDKLLTQEQYDRAVMKARGDAHKDSQNEVGKNSAAETRRFDFRIPGNVQNKDDAPAKETAKNTGQMLPQISTLVTLTQDMWRYQKQQNDNQQQVVNW